MNLISLDSPFAPDLVEENTRGLEDDFETYWETLGEHNAARGWCGSSVADIVRRLQGLPDHRLQVFDTEAAPYAGTNSFELFSSARADSLHRRTKNDS